MSYNESRNADSNYPAMSQFEWDNAPFNRKDSEEKEFEVTVSVTLSKTFKIYTDDYDEIDEPPEEDGGGYYSCTPNNLEETVEEQIILPQEAFKYINGNTEKGKQAIEDLKGWNVDDMAVNYD